ncbi:hypothetical protein DE146DRAFT_255853 [Phaeosphaeria sp. MPI-PUGE-AT-0046c]|nr:hypothetical protein DE146DRAFT_255853 [Phaeosphaeria sp. MPI-PUGE-AT-0046c]
MDIFTVPQFPKSMLERTTPSVLRDEHVGFILQSIPDTSNYVCFGASFTYHFPTRHMYIYIQGLASTNYHRFAESVERGSAKESAFLIPSMLIQFNIEQRQVSLGIWADLVYWNERKLGIRSDHADVSDPIDIDYTTLSKELNAANTSLAYHAWSGRHTARQLLFMDQVANRYRVQAVKNGILDEAAAEVEQLLLETHSHLRAWNTGLQDRVDYLSKRVQSLVQTVHSGIAQRDSAVSLRLASTSTDLAESSQMVAISTSRDSAVMRVIAAITIFFLPPTFTATFFSTSFFSFNANLDGKIYSGWLWLYFVVSAILTAIVVVGTWMLWKGKEKEISEGFEKRNGPEVRTAEWKT